MSKREPIHYPRDETSGGVVYVAFNRSTLPGVVSLRPYHRLPSRCPRKLIKAPNCIRCGYPFISSNPLVLSIICDHCKVTSKPNTKRHRINCDCGQETQEVFLFQIVTDRKLTIVKIPLCSACQQLESE